VYIDDIIISGRNIDKNFFYDIQKLIASYNLPYHKYNKNNNKAIFYSAKSVKEGILRLIINQKAYIKLPNKKHKEIKDYLLITEFNIKKLNDKYSYSKSV